MFLVFANSTDYIIRQTIRHRKTGQFFGLLIEAIESVRRTCPNISGMVFLQNIPYPVFNQSIHIAVINETLIHRIEATDTFIVSQPDHSLTITEDVVHPVICQFIPGQVARLIFRRLIMFQLPCHQIIAVETRTESSDIKVLMPIFRNRENLLIVHRQRIFALTGSPV